MYCLPVLSDAMTVHDPKVSTEFNCLIKTFLSANRLAVIVKAETIVIGKPRKNKKTNKRLN